MEQLSTEALQIVEDKDVEYVESTGIDRKIAAQDDAVPMELFAFPTHSEDNSTHKVTIKPSTPLKYKRIAKLNSTYWEKLKTYLQQPVIATNGMAENGDLRITN